MGAPAVEPPNNSTRCSSAPASALARHVIGLYRSKSGGTERVSEGCSFRVGGGRGVAAGAGWGCSRWCSRSTVGVAIIFPPRVLAAACCSVSNGTAAVAPLLVASLVGSGVVRPLGSLSLCHSACREQLARRRSRSICCRCDPPHASTSRCVWREGALPEGTKALRQLCLFVLGVNRPIFMHAAAYSLSVRTTSLPYRLEGAGQVDRPRGPSAIRRVKRACCPSR